MPFFANSAREKIFRRYLPEGLQQLHIRVRLKIKKPGSFSPALNEPGLSAGYVRQLRFCAAFTTFDILGCFVYNSLFL